MYERECVYERKCVYERETHTRTHRHREREKSIKFGYMKLNSSFFIFFQKRRRINSVAPVVVIYSPDMIHFICPLKDQKQFCVQF